jgi:hypothetical protein
LSVNSSRAVGGFDVVVGDVIPDAVEILAGARREDEARHPMARFRSGYASRQRTRRGRPVRTDCDFLSQCRHAEPL